MKSNSDPPSRNFASTATTSDHRLLPVILGLFAFASVSATIGDPGLTWDEPASLYASEYYVDWLLSPSLAAGAIDRAWGLNHEHPPLAKIWIGIVRRTVQFIYPDFPALLGSRLATAMLFGALVALLCSAASRLGAAAGISAALFALLMPRLFAHAHFAALDLPMALAWFATAWAFARGINSRRWAVAAGVLFGGALLTKINAVFIPLPLIVWAALAHRKKAILPVAMLLGIGAAVFLAGWPWLWHGTLARLHGYFLGTTVGRFRVPVYYLGTIYSQTSEGHVPWHYPVILTLLTVPPGILLCLVLGLLRVRPRGGGSGPPRGGIVLTPGFAAANFAAILIVAALPIAPKYDGVRLFLAAFPFAAFIAGVGFQRLWDWWGPRRSRTVLACAFVALQGLGIVLYHPYETSYYNLLCAGLPGARKLGMETTYWGDVYSGPVLECVKRLPPGSRVAFFPLSTFVRPIYEEEGYVSADFTKDPFDYAVLMAREGMLLQNEQATRLFREGEPLLAIRRLGVTLCVVKRAPEEQG